MSNCTDDGPLTKNLQGYWQFDGNGSDASDNARNLGLVGGIGFEEGLFGQALSFNGDESRYAQRPIDDQVFDFGGSDFTVQTWVNFNTTSGEQTLVEKWVDVGYFGWTLTKLPGDTLRFAFGGESTLTHHNSPFQPDSFISLLFLEVERTSVCSSMGKWFGA